MNLDYSSGAVAPPNRAKGDLYTRKMGYAAWGLMVFISLGVCDAQADLQTGRFGASQVFDIQRSPAFPVGASNFAISNFALPFGNGQDQAGQYTTNPGKYIQFEDVDPPPATCDYEINLYASDGTFISGITSGASIYGLGSEAFLHISSPGGFGTFVANGAGFAPGDGLSYIPDTGFATCAQVEAFAPSTTPASTPGPISSSPPSSNSSSATPVPARPRGFWVLGSVFDDRWDSRGRGKVANQTCSGGSTVNNSPHHSLSLSTRLVPIDFGPRSLGAVVSS